MTKTATFAVALDNPEPYDGFVFNQHADRLLETLLDYGHKIAHTNFASFPLKTIASRSQIPYSKSDKSQILLALQYHQDVNTLQFSVSSGGSRGDTLYVRWRDEVEPESEIDPVTTTLCRPMKGTDILAICAMVQNGMRGVHSLTGHPKSKLETWRNRGISTKREDARQSLLTQILIPHLTAGVKLIDEPLQLERWVEERAKEAVVRTQRMADLLEIGREYTPPEPEPEPEKAPVTTTTPTKTRVCGICKTAKLKGDEMLCRACSIKLMKESGAAPVVVAEPMSAPDWRSPIEQLVATNGAEIGLAQETYCAVAAGLHQAHLAIDEVAKQGHTIDLGALGVYIDGHNLDMAKAHKAEESDDVETEKGRKGYVRVLQRWVLNPQRLQDSASKLKSKLQTVAGPLQRLLVDLQDEEGGKDLRSAIGSHASVQDLMDAANTTLLLQYLINDLVGQLTPDTSNDG